MTIQIELPETTLAALKADAKAQGRTAEELAAEHLAAFYVDQDDEEAAVEEALGELEAGKGRPFAEFAEEFSARFAQRFRRE